MCSNLAEVRLAAEMMEEEYLCYGPGHLQRKDCSQVDLLQLLGQNVALVSIAQAADHHLVEAQYGHHLCYGPAFEHH